MINKEYGFVKLYRGLTDWRWYTSSNTLRLYIHCLMNAYYKKTERLDMEIHAGSFETSYRKLARELDLTEKQIRTALYNLKKTGEVTVRPTRKCSIITVIGFIEDQLYGKEPSSVKALKSLHQGDKTSTNKEEKNIRKEEIICGL